MEDPRVHALQRMLERNPNDTRVLFGLAAEMEKAGRWEETAQHLRAYLALAEDEGNAWGRLGHALRQQGRDAEAREAYVRGVVEANRHGHPSMAAEFEEVLEEWE